MKMCIPVSGSRAGLLQRLAQRPHLKNTTSLFYARIIWIFLSLFNASKIRVYLKTMKKGIYLQSFLLNTDEGFNGFVVFTWTSFWK
jgi:hypothetical protein